MGDSIAAVARKPLRYLEERYRSGEALAATLPHDLRALLRSLLRPARNYPGSRRNVCIRAQFRSESDRARKTRFNHFAALYRGANLVVNSDR
jgi:hypothetical protein